MSLPSPDIPSVVKPDTKVEIPLPEINAKLAQLKKFETDLQNPEVEKAKEAMHKIIDPLFPWFDEHGVVVTYHGSLQYNDPNNLDADIVFVSENLGFQDMEPQILELEDKFQRSGVWPREVCDPNFSEPNIVKIKQELSEIGQETRYDHDDEAYEDYFSDISASFILSSALLYENQRPQFEQLQTKTREFIAGNQWLRGGVNYWLDNAIEVRQERRKRMQGLA